MKDTTNVSIKKEIMERLLTIGQLQDRSASKVATRILARAFEVYDNETKGIKNEGSLFLNLLKGDED